MMSCRVSAAASRLRRFFWPINLVLCIAQSGQKCIEPKKYLVYYIRLVRDIGFRWFYMSKCVKNDVKQGFCSWFAVTECVLAVKLCFMFNWEWSQEPGTEETSWLLHPFGPRHRLSVVLYVKMVKKCCNAGFLLLVFGCGGSCDCEA